MKRLLFLIPGLISGQTFFDDRVAPILRERCLACHNEQLKNGGVSFTSRDALLKPGKRGAVIVPGKAKESLLVQAVHHDGEVKMPPGSKLPASEITLLEQWINRGAPWGNKMMAAPAAPRFPFEIWTFDRLKDIGGHATTVEGHPRVAGGAVEFNGVDDALFLDIHPLAEAEIFTWEVIFRPDGGKAEQRFFHLQEDGTVNRLLFEIRVIDGKWCLDSFAMSATGSKTLMDRSKLHSLGEWHHAAMVYDGREFRNYVDGVLQGGGEARLAPQKAGRTSVGVRINKVDYFKGAIKMARFTRGALTPADFLTLNNAAR